MNPPTLSTGQPSTCGIWLDNCKAFFGSDSPTIKFWEGKIKESPLGREEPVLADEGQTLQIMLTLEMNHESEYFGA